MNEVLEKTENNQKTKGVVKPKDIVTLIEKKLKENPDIPFNEIVKLSAFDARDEKLIPALTDNILPSKNNTPFVMSVNADWGYGKTTFVKLWQAYLKQESYKTIYFNAWENDFSDNPFASFISSFKNLGDSEKFKDLKEEAKKVAKVMLPAIAKIGTHIFASKLGLEGKGIEKICAETSGKFTELLLEEQFEEEENLKAIREAFKEKLKNIAEDEEKPIIVFIDELDRCKPSYAVELLEEIKHLFSVEGFIFVLAINKKALGEIVSCNSGLQDIDEYLERFIDYQFNLPKPTTDEFTNYLIEQHKYKIDKNESFIKTFTALSKSFNVSLRTQKQCFINYKIVESLLENETWDKMYKKCLPVLIPFLLILKTKEPAKYYEICNTDIQDSDFDKYQKVKDIEQYFDFEFKHSVEGGLLLAIIFTSKMQNEVEVSKFSKEKVISSYSDVLTGQVQKQIQFIGECAEKSEFRHSIPFKIIQIIYKKIELLNF